MAQQTEETRANKGHPAITQSRNKTGQKQAHNNHKKQGKQTTAKQKQHKTQQRQNKADQNVVIKPNRMLSLDKFTEEVNKCNVMVGAHGAGLTNEVFLPDGAVVVQVVPLGLDWAASNYFGAPASEMGLNYLGVQDLTKGELTLGDLW
ncbi:hypothetical protein LWI29_030915 [Acer saccharum]|uniref:Uncharacterized protein n=1 Tax=Acer saccharum TaxID=4024 RepID=A0AA39W2Y8_ACESA|nr:hypothetical protein LWI29_030915 [Acer saccharum]